MRVLLDECLPRGLKAAIIGHDVSTVPEIGWAGLPDHVILEQAATRVDVFITVDRLMAGQSWSPLDPLRVIILVAPSNRLSDLLPSLRPYEPRSKRFSLGRSSDYNLLSACAHGCGLGARLPVCCKREGKLSVTSLTVARLRPIPLNGP
jgi:hypothetical protein